MAGFSPAKTQLDIEHHLPGERLSHSVILLAAAMIALIWLLSSWLIATQFAHWRGQEQIGANEKQAQQSVQNIALGIERTLTVLQGIPAAIAHDEALVSALKQISQRPGIYSPDTVRKAWFAESELRVLNRKISTIQRGIGALSVIWVMDTRGFTWLTTNAGTPESLLGNNYSDRAYFKEALEGYNGRQFAIGRSTKSPGLFFSAPILQEDQVVGIVAGKLELTYLSASIDQTNAFVSDEHGVIVLAQDKSLEMRTLSDSTVMRLTQTERKNTYQRLDFKPLSLSPWGDSRFPTLSRLDNKEIPFLFKLRAVPYQEISIGILQPLPGINRLTSDQWVLFTLLAGVGCLAIGGVAITTIYINNTRRVKQAITARNLEIQQRNQLLQHIVQGQAISETLPLIAKFTQNQFSGSQCLIYLLTEDEDHLQLAAAPSIPASFHHRFSGYRLTAEDSPWTKELADFAETECNENNPSTLCLTLGKLLTGSSKSTLWSAAFRDHNSRLLGILTLAQTSLSPATEAQRSMLIACARLAALAIMHDQASSDLIRARDSAEAANLNKGSFLANMSHEIRTPMNGVLGMNALLLETELTPEQKDYAENAYSSAQALLGVIDDILDFSKIEAGKLTIEHVEFDLSTMLNDVDKLFIHLANKKHIELSRLIPPDLPLLLRGDPTRLRQLLVNLISNAIKFTATGTVCYGIELISSTEHATTLRFSVTDTGIGIPPDQLGLLFSPFVQADASVTRQFGGTGLGLSICKNLVELMGGTIGVESKVNSGSRFWFVLPFDLQCGSIEAATPNIVPVLISKRILLVEDNPVNQRLALTLLKRQGHEVEIAQDGIDALKLLTKRDFDLVLMDCRMPNMDGYEATRAIRQGERGVRNPDIPIIAMTANAMTGDKELVIEAGMNDYLTKPISQQKLHEVLQQWLGKSDDTVNDTK